MSESDLDAIERRAHAAVACPVLVHNDHDLDRYAVCRFDVPRMIAEIRQLRSSSALSSAARAGDGGE